MVMTLSTEGGNINTDYVTIDTNIAHTIIIRNNMISNYIWVLIGRGRQRCEKHARAREYARLHKSIVSM